MLDPPSSKCPFEKSAKPLCFQVSDGEWGGPAVGQEESRQPKSHSQSQFPFLFLRDTIRLLELGGQAVSMRSASAGRIRRWVLECLRWNQVHGEAPEGLGSSPLSRSRGLEKRSVGDIFSLLLRAASHPVNMPTPMPIAKRIATERSGSCLMRGPFSFRPGLQRCNGCVWPTAWPQSLHLQRREKPHPSAARSSAATCATCSPTCLAFLRKLISLFSAIKSIPSFMGQCPLPTVWYRATDFPFNTTIAPDRRRLTAVAPGSRTA